MKKQVLSIEQMKHLHELGLDTSQASMEYIEDNNGKILCISKENKHNIKDIEEGFIICEALTLQDILDLLPEKLDTNTERYNLNMWYGIYKEKWCMGYTYSECKYDDYCSTGDNLIDAAYDMLCWCIENGYIITNKFNHESNNNL